MNVRQIAKHDLYWLTDWLVYSDETNVHPHWIEHWKFVSLVSGCYHSLDGAILFSNTVLSKLRSNVNNEILLICAKFGVDLINTSKVTSRKTKWPRFHAPPCICKNTLQHNEWSSLNSFYTILCQLCSCRPCSYIWVVRPWREKEKAEEWDEAVWEKRKEDGARVENGIPKGQFDPRSGVFWNAKGSGCTFCKYFTLLLAYSIPLMIN